MERRDVLGGPGLRVLKPKFQEFFSQIQKLPRERLRFLRTGEWLVFIHFFSQTTVFNHHTTHTTLASWGSREELVLAPQVTSGRDPYTPSLSQASSPRLYGEGTAEHLAMEEAADGVPGYSHSAFGPGHRHRCQSDGIFYLPLYAKICFAWLHILTVSILDREGCDWRAKENTPIGTGIRVPLLRTPTSPKFVQGKKQRSLETEYFVSFWNVTFEDYIHIMGKTIQHSIITASAQRRLSCARHHVWLLHEQYDLNQESREIVQLVKILLHKQEDLNLIASTTSIIKQAGVWLTHLWAQHSEGGKRRASLASRT